MPDYIIVVPFFVGLFCSFKAVNTCIIVPNATYTDVQFRASGITQAKWQIATLVNAIAILIIAF